MRIIIDYPLAIFQYIYRQSVCNHLSVVDLSTLQQVKTNFKVTFYSKAFGKTA